MSGRGATPTTRPESDRVPVIALTGHLGAGKTTLLNELLLHPGARVGVVVNDFGDVNIDAGLISGQVDQVGSIAGGCICCLDDSDDLDDALERLARPRLGLDAVVVEASGIADPISLARMIRYSGAERVRLGGVVDVVDAVNFFDTIGGGALPPARFGVATLVVVNKCDLLPGEIRDQTLDRIEERVREVNPLVHVVHTARGRLDPALVFDVSSAQDPDDQLPIAALLREAHAARHVSARADAHDHVHDHVHATSVSVRSPGPVEPGALVDLLEDPPAGAYRLKGRFSIDTGRSRPGYVAHVVGRHVHVLGTSAPASHSELVAIGVGLDTAVVRRRMQRALAPAGRSSLAGYRRLQRLRRISE